MFGESALNGLNCIDEECEAFYYLKTHLKMSKDHNIIGSKYNFDPIYLCQFFTYCQCSL